MKLIFYAKLGRTSIKWGFALSVITIWLLMVVCFSVTNVGHSIFTVPQCVSC